MSETSEHSPDDTDAEAKTMEDLPNDSSKSETKLMMNQTSTALLEDEEMPTYISVSSISKREDDSDVANAKQAENVSMEEEHSPSPYPSDDQAASSVYILSSGEETDQLPYNDEDDEDEYGDSDVMENLELDNDIDAEHANNMKHLMDEEDDDDDEEDEEDDEGSPMRMHNDDDDIDECYDRASADFVLSKGLKRRDKEKSSSLQDLSLYKNNMYTEYNKRKRPNVVRQHYLNIPQDIAMCPIEHRQQLMPGRYHHIQSKVKLYIKDVREQNRRSMEKHMKNHEDTTHDQSNVDCKNNDTEEMTSTVANKLIKNYAEKAIKELEIAEACDKDRAPYNPSSLILNGRNNKNRLKSMQEENMQTEIQVSALFESTQDKTSSASPDNKMEQKQNGMLEATSLEGETRQPQDTITMQSSLIQNGHQEVPTVLFNLRTLSYEEYMHGTSESSQKTDLNQNARAIEQEHIRSKAYSNAKPMDVSEMDDDDTTYPQPRIKDIKSVKTMVDEAKSNNEQIIFDKTNEEHSKTTSDISEVISLKDQLNQKIEQYNNLHDTYRKQLAENVEMKQELEKLRKSLMIYEKESKVPEQKVASIQTDPIADTTAKDVHNQRETTYIKQPKNKISGSSVGSTLSSIEQWTDSACNLSISMKPPELTKALHSDDSMLLTDATPRKNTRSLSRAFITSSRILQTLSNITQGKTKSDNPLVQNSKRRLNENAAMELQNDDDSYQSRPSSSKKRKIADILGPSSFLQSFKAFPSVAETHLKLDETPNAEFRFKCDSVNKRLESQNNLSNGNTSKLGDATSIENKAENSEDPENNVKCIIYHENENSRNRSFLIQTEEAAKDKVINEKSCFRECGPFLLGNVEVRMSEINGTINIWGKEINDESTTENEKMEISTSIKNDKKCYCCQKTPHTKFNGSNIVCSSTKKSKIPAKLELSSIASNISCPHSTSFNTPKQSCSTDKIHTDNLYSPNVCVSSCENCDSSKLRKEWLRYKRVYPQEKSHSCCTHNIDILGQKCNSALHKQNLKDNYNCSKEKCSAKEHRQNSSGNLEPNKHLNENIADPTTEANEAVCKCRTVYHGSHDPGENCSKNQKSCAVSKEASACEQLSMNTDRECNETCTHNSPNIDEDEPLITKQFSESPEMRRRRLSGKRVRGILMDLLRGCGDCYNPHASNSSKDCSHKKEVSHLTSCSPQIRISPCASPEPSCSNPGPSNGRCCHVYAQRIESQLEEFRVEMEKVRSRSDAILDMLNMFHSMDAN